MDSAQLSATQRDSAQLSLTQLSSTQLNSVQLSSAVWWAPSGEYRLVGTVKWAPSGGHREVGTVWRAPLGTVGHQLQTAQALRGLSLTQFDSVQALIIF